MAKTKKPNFRVKHPYGYLIKSMLIGLVLVFTSILSMATGVVNLTPKSTTEAATSGNWSSYASSSYNPATISKGFASGDGSKSSPFLIKTVSQWRCFADFVYNWNGGYKYYFALGADIDFAGHYYDPLMVVGNVNTSRSVTGKAHNQNTVVATSTKATSFGTTAKSFAGVFYGNGYRIKNVTMDDGAMVSGLFATISGVSNVPTSESHTTAPNYNESYYATAIYDLVIQDMNEEPGQCGEYFGGLAGIAHRAVISNVFVYSTKGYSFSCFAGAMIGGLVGVTKGCQFYGCKVDGIKIYACGGIGGLVGEVESGYGHNYFVNCHSNATVASSLKIANSAGGLVGGASYSSSSYLVIRNCWNTGDVYLDRVLGSASTDGMNTNEYTSWINNGQLAGLVGGGGNSNYLYIMNSYNAGNPYVKCHIDGDTESYGYYQGYALAYEYNAVSSAYKNYYDEGRAIYSNGRYRGSSNNSTTYESAVSASALKTVSNSSTSLGYCTTCTGYYVSGNSASNGFAFPMHSVFPVSGNSAYNSSNEVAKESETFTSNQHLGRIGKAVAKKVKVTFESGGSVNSTTYLTRQTTSSNYMRVPSNNYASSITIKSPAGYSIEITVNAYSVAGVISTTTSTVGISSSTATATKTINFDKDDVREHEIIVKTSKYLEGSGTSSNPYKIKSADDLQGLSANTTGKYYTLTNDIEAPSSTYVNSYNTLVDGTFNGYLDGCGYTLDITNLDGTVPIFRAIGSGAIVHNLNILASVKYYNTSSSSVVYPSKTNASQTYRNHLGFTLSATNAGIVDAVNLYIFGNAYISYYSQWNTGYTVSCGLLVAENSGTITNCYVGPIDEGLDYINSNGTVYNYWKGVPILGISIQTDANIATDFYVGVLCGSNTGNIIGNSVSAHIYASPVEPIVAENGCTFACGHIVGRDARASGKKLCDNFAEGVMEVAVGDYEMTYIGGVAGKLEGSNNYTERNISQVATVNSYQDSMFGYATSDLSDSNFFLATSTLGVGSTGSDANKGSGGQTFTALSPTSSNKNKFSNFNGLDFDPEYWIALSGNEGISGYCDDFAGELYYPRSKKTFGSTVVSNNWCKDNGASLSITSSTTSINIANALQLGKLVEYINTNGQGSLATINITADIYLYGKYWTPISFLSDVTINGNNHTIYGLDSLGTKGGGLVDSEDFVIVNNLKLEDCMVRVGSLYSSYALGIIANYSEGGDLKLNNVTFSNCHICVDSEICAYSINAGFAISYSTGGFTTLNNVTIKAEEASVVQNSSIDVNIKDYDISSNYNYVGGFYGFSIGAYANNITINGFDINISSIGSGYLGGLFGQVSGGGEEGSYLKNSDIVALTININETSDSYNLPTRIGGISGYYGITIDSCIIGIDIRLNTLKDASLCSIGGIYGYATTTSITNSDIDVRIKNFTSYTTSAAYNAITGIQMASASANLTFNNNIYRFESNMFSTSNKGWGVVALISGGEGKYCAKNNLIYIKANNYNYVSFTNDQDFGDITLSNNAIIFASGNAGTVYTYCHEYDIWYSTSTLSTSQVASLVNGGGSLVGNDFFANKYIKTGWDNSGPYVRNFNEDDTDPIVPFKDKTAAHYFSSLYIGGVGFGIYNVLQECTKISAQNSLGNSNTAVTVTRNGQYTLPYTSLGSSPTIYTVAGDVYTFTLNDDSHKYSASLVEYDYGDQAVGSSFAIASERTSNYTYTLSKPNSTYWNDQDSGWLVLKVDIMQAYRYFAVDADMEVSGAVAVDVRADYVVYGAQEGDSVTVKRTGNTTGYSASDTWSGVNFMTDSMPINGSCIWTDGENTYYSYNSTQYVLNKSTSRWSTKTWNGLTSFIRSYIWTDGTNIYYSSGSTHYVLNKSTSTWSTKTWNGLTSFYGNSIWTDGTNIYYSQGSDQYVLNKSTSTWSSKTWSGLTSFDENYIWTDGENTYYSFYNSQYILNKSTSTWSTKTWSGLTSFDGRNIWTDGTNIYYSSGSTQRILNKSTSTWSTKTWSGLTSFDGRNIWTDGTNIYCSDGNIQYILSGSTWSRKTWSGPFSGDFDYIWTDGENTYYSFYNSQYILNKSTSTWSTKTWSGLTSFDENYIWTDGTNIYYSSGSQQYVLNKSTSTWSTKTWSGLTSFYGRNIWTDGTNIYYSGGSTQYVLNKSTSTWSTKTWSGLTSFYGRNIWTDGTNIYYSQGSDQYVLNKSTSTWSSKTWSGLTSLYGYRIWTDGTNIYYSCGPQYVLNKSTSTWSTKTWSGLTSFSGEYIWTDGTNIYVNNYVLDNAYVSGLTKGALNSSNTYSSTSTLSGTTGTNSNGYRSYTFSVTTSNTSSSKTGSLTAYSYSTEKMYKHSIQNNAGLSSSQVYLTSSLTGSTKYTSLFVRPGTDIKLNYPASSGEYENPVVTRTGSVNNTAASGYNYTATTSNVVNTITYSEKKYQDKIYISQEGVTYGTGDNKYYNTYSADITGTLNIDKSIWGGYDDNLMVSTHWSGATTETQKWSSFTNFNPKGIRKGAYVSIDGENYIGYLSTDSYNYQSMTELKQAGTCVSATIHIPSGFKLGGIKYGTTTFSEYDNYDEFVEWFDDYHRVALVGYYVKNPTTNEVYFCYSTQSGGGTLYIDVVQDKWDDSDNMVAPTGSGTDSSPYAIDSAGKFGWMVNKINSTDTSYASKYYQISSDIDLAGKYISPIVTFSGTIDGTTSLHSIKNMNIWARDAEFINYNNGTLQNLIFVDPCFTGYYTAGLVYNNGSYSISNNNNISFTSGNIFNVGIRSDSTTRGMVARYGSSLGEVATVMINYPNSSMYNVFDASRVFGTYFGLARTNYGKIGTVYTSINQSKVDSRNVDFYGLNFESKKFDVSSYANKNSVSVGEPNMYTCYVRNSSNGVASTRYVYHNATNATIGAIVFVGGEYSSTTGYYSNSNCTTEDIVGLTTAQLKDSTYYPSSWSMGEWIFNPARSDVSNGIYNGQKYDENNTYPLLTMYKATNLREVKFVYSFSNDGSTSTGNMSSGTLAQYGWSMGNSSIWVEPGKAFNFKVTKNSINYDTPLYLTSISNKSGFSNSFSLTPSRYATATYTVSASNSAFSGNTAEILLTFCPATSSFNADFNPDLEIKDANGNAIKVMNSHDRYAVAASTSSNGTARSITYNYAISSSYGPLVVQTLKVGTAEILTEHSTTAVTKYIYLSGTTYSANSSKSGTGTYVGKVVVTPTSARAGKIEIYELKESISIVAELYMALQISYSGLASGTSNTITSYYSTSAITTSTTATKIADVRSSGGSASGTSSTYYVPVQDRGEVLYFGSVLGGNISNYTYGTVGYNDTSTNVNGNYASTNNYAHSVGAAKLIDTTNSTAKLVYNYGPGAWTYTVTLNLSKTSTRPSAVSVKLLSGSTEKETKSYTSIATNEKVEFDVSASWTNIKLQAVVTAGTGKAYRVIWNNLTTGSSGNNLNCANPTQARNYTLYVVELFKAELSNTKSYTYSEKTFTSTYKNYEPVLTITYASSGLVGSANGTVSNSSTATQRSVSTSQVIDYGSQVTYSQGDRKGIGSYESGNVSINFSDVFNSGSLSTSSVSSITSNSSSSVTSTIKVVTITTQITNKDLTYHPDTYIGIARRDLSELGYNFSSSTLHTTDSSGAYYIYYNGLTSSTGSGDSVVRGHRTFLVSAGEKVEARRWDLKGSGYANDIASVTHTNSANYSVEKKEGDTLLLGLDMYVKANDTISFTYYPLVNISLTRNAITTSKYATDNKDTLLPVNSERKSTANIIVKGTKDSNGTYAYSTIDTLQNLFEPIVYMQITYRVPTANLTGWNFTGWTVVSTTFTAKTTVGDIEYTPSIDTTSESGYTLYHLTFTIVKQSSKENTSINNFQYKINFSEKTYTLTANSSLTSGESTSVNNTVAKKTLFEYTSSDYLEEGKITHVKDSTTAISFTAGYFGYYKVFYTTTEANDYEYASGNNGDEINKKTSTYNSTATFKKWHTISAPTISVVYVTTGYTDDETGGKYVITNGDNEYKYIFSACKTGSTTALDEIATITLSGITMKDGAMKVLEGNTLTVNYTTNTNKFNCKTAPASKEITADTEISGAFAENIISIYFYRNTETSEKLNTAAIKLGSLNNTYDIPADYQASPGDEYEFEKWTSNAQVSGGTLTFVKETNANTSIKELSASGIDPVYNIYANWRRVNCYTYTQKKSEETILVETIHKTSGRSSVVGGTFDTLSISTSPEAGSNKKYKYSNTATVSATAKTGYKFSKWNAPNGNISGNTISRKYSTCIIANNQIIYGGQTLYVSGGILYYDSVHVVHYASYDYQISGNNVFIYDKTEIEITPVFEEQTFTLNITQPTGGKITITSTTSLGDTQTSNGLPTSIVLGYFSTVTLAYTNTNDSYRFSGWKYDTTAFGTATLSNQTITLGTNVLKNSEVSVTEATQAKITDTSNVFLLRYYENNTQNWPLQTVRDIKLDGNKVVWIYDNFVLVYEIDGNNQIMTKNWTRTCTNSSHATTNLSSRTTACNNCKFTNVEMYVVLNDTTPDTLKITMHLGNYVINNVNVALNPNSAEFYACGFDNVDLWKANIGYQSTYLSLAGNAKTSVVASIVASSTGFDTVLPIDEWSARLYSQVDADDHTSTNNNKVYVATQNQSSVKVLEGTGATIYAKDYEDNSADKTYKFSHWTFVPSDTTYGDADWMSTGSSTGDDISHNAQNTFSVYASRAGTYTAHYKYAYKLNTDTGKTTDGSTFTVANITSATLSATGTKYYSADSKYLAGSSITLTATCMNNYAFYGWYLYNGSAYTKITSSTTGFTSVADGSLTFTVGGTNCDGSTISGVDLTTYTIVYIGIPLLEYKFGGETGAPSATYTVSGAGVYSVTGGTLSGTTATMTATGGTCMSVFVKEGTSITFTMTKTDVTARAVGVLYGSSTLNANSSPKVTFEHSGITKLSFALTATQNNNGKYEVVYTKIFTIVAKSQMTVSDTHVTSNYSDTTTITNSIITVSASGGITYSGVVYYDYNTQVTLTANVPAGHEFDSWKVNGTTYSSYQNVMLTQSITSVALNISEIEYTISKETKVTIPAGFNSSVTSATTWTSDSFGSFTYTSNHKSDNTKVGYFGTITIGTFTSGKNLYISSGKAYYDSEHDHEVYSGLCSISGSTLTYLGTSYSIANNMAQIWNMYTNPTYSTSKGTLSSGTITAINGNVTITLTAEMQGALRYVTRNNKTNNTIDTTSETLQKMCTTKTYTAPTKSGYVFKGWVEYNCNNVRKTATGSYYSTNSSITVTQNEENNGNYYVAIYNPTFTLTVGANTFDQCGSIKVTIGTTTETLTNPTQSKEYSNIEYGTNITLVATAKGQNRTNYWSANNDGQSLSESGDTITFSIQGTATATHVFLTQFTINITHTKNYTSTGGTWTIQESRKEGTTWLDWANVTTTGFVDATGSKEFTKADGGHRYRVVVTTSTHHNVVLSASNNSASISGSNNTYVTSGTLTSYVYLNGTQSTSSGTTDYTGVTQNSTVVITHTGLNYINFTTTQSGLGNTVKVGENKAGSTTGTSKLEGVVYTNKGSATLSTTAVSGYDAPTWKVDGTTVATSSISTTTDNGVTVYGYTLNNNSLGHTYNVVVSYPDNSGKTINLTVSGFANKFAYSSVVDGSAKNTTNLTHTYSVSGLSLTNNLTALRFSGFDKNEVKKVTISDGTNSYNVNIASADSYVDYPIPSGVNTINLTLTITNNTWVDSGNYTAPTSGTGTATDPYQIANASNFAWISYKSAKDNENFAGKYFVQTGNIDLAGHLWLPIQNFNGVFVGNHDYSITGQKSYGHPYNFVDSTLTGDYDYSIGSLFANSNGGVFKNLHIADVNYMIQSVYESCLDMVETTTNSLLLGNAYNVIIDGIIIEDSDLYGFGCTDTSAGLLVAKLYGSGKITNVKITNCFVSSSEADKGLLIGEILPYTSQHSYFDSNGKSAYIVLENIYIDGNQQGDSGIIYTDSAIAGTIKVDVSMSNVYVDMGGTAVNYFIDTLTSSVTVKMENVVIWNIYGGNSYNVINSISSGCVLNCTDVYYNKINNGTFCSLSGVSGVTRITSQTALLNAIKTLYNKGGNVWYSAYNGTTHIASGMDIFGEFKTTYSNYGATNDNVTITNGVIKLSGNISIAKFKNALSALVNNSAVTKVELLNSIDFGGATLDTEYHIPARKTFDGHGHTISGIKAVRTLKGNSSYSSAIFSTISGTLKRTVFDNIYMYVSTKSTYISYSHIGLASGYSNGPTISNVTVKNSRLNIAFDGVCASTSVTETPNIGMFVGASDKSNFSYIDITNSKLTFSQYGVSSSEVFKLAGFVSYSFSGSMNNIQVGTDIIVDSNATTNMVAGLVASLGTGITNASMTGDITTTSSASNVYPVTGRPLGSYTVSKAYVSGTFSPKASTLYGTTSNITYTNVYISANASSASGTKTDTEMKTQSTYTGFNFSATANNTNQTLAWYMGNAGNAPYYDAYPHFAVASNHMKVTINLSGDGTSCADNIVSLGRDTEAHNDGYDKYGLAKVNTAGTTSRLYPVRSNENDNYFFLIEVALEEGYYLDVSESTVNVDESSSTTTLQNLATSLNTTLNDVYGDQTIQLPMTSSTNYDTVFNLVIKKAEYTITATASGHGSVTSGAGSYKTGESVSLVATTNTSDDEYRQHRFVGWYKGTTQVSTNLTYTFVASEDTAGAYEARFCSSDNCQFKAKASITAGAISTVSPADSGFKNVGTSTSFVVNLDVSEEIVSIKHDGVAIYTKEDGVKNSAYTVELSGSTLTLTFSMNVNTKGAYVFEKGETASLVTVNIPNVGGSTRSEVDAYSAHGAITLTSGSTSSTIGANASTGTINVLYNQTLTITFMSNIRYKLGSITTTIAGGKTSFTTSTSTVEGYTRYTYTYVTDAITDVTTITLNLVKDRWVDISYNSSTSTYTFGAGHSTEFITANGGNPAYEISSSSATFGTSQAYKGLSGNPFIISTASQLARVSYLVNNNATFMTYVDGTLTQVYYHNAYYKITADIDLNNYFWTPINATYSVSTYMNIISETQKSIKNMYVRYDKEEAAIDHNAYLKYGGFIAVSVGDSFTGITFDNAVIYNSNISCYCGVVAGQLFRTQLNFVTVKNSTIEFSGSAGGFSAIASYGTVFNYINMTSVTVKAIDDTSSALAFGGITLYCYESTLNNVSINGLNITNSTSNPLYSAGIIHSSFSGIVNNAIIDNVTITGQYTDFASVSVYAYYGSEFINVWSKSTTHYINNNYSNSTINLLSGTPNLNTLGLSSDTWYVSNGVAYVKGYGTGTNTISRIADVTTGGFAGGTGTQSDPYLIATADQFRYLQYLVNSGNSTYNNINKYYKITADLDLGGGISDMLGTCLDDNYYKENYTKRFRGHLDGDFHTISNMIIFDPYNNKFVGFMPYPNTGATLKNLNLDKYTVFGNANYIGGIVGSGYVGVNIDNVSITNGYVAGRSNVVGGLVGYTTNISSDSIIQNSSFSGVLVGAVSDAQGGILAFVGYSNTDYNIYIQNCSSDGILLNSTNSSVGGILGYSQSSTHTAKTYITNCHNNMKLLVCAGGVGGIAGYTYNTKIENCYNNGEIVLFTYVGTGSSSTTYNTNVNFNNGTYSLGTDYNTFYGEIIGRNFNNTSNTTSITNTYYNEAKKIVLSSSTSTGIILPYGDKDILGHTPNGYSVWTTSRDIEPTYTTNLGNAEMKNESELKELGNFSSWDTNTVWSVGGTSLPVHRWATQNRLYFEGSGLAISSDGNAVLLNNGKITFASGVKPVQDSSGRIYVYASGSSLDVTFVPNTNNVLESAQVREYYGTTYSALSGTSISFGSYSDGTSFKVLKVSFVNSKFTITVNTTLSRGNGIAVGEYETLHIVILNKTTNEAYTCTLDNGTYVFDALTAGTYYVAVYTSMFFNVSNITCSTTGIDFDEAEFYHTLVLSNSTSADAVINITANKTVDAWIYSKVEIGA